MGRAFLFAVVGVLVAVATADGEPAIPFHRGVGRPKGSPQQRVQKRRRQPQIWKIPAGKFGLQLSDGTRMIGVPEKGWSASLKTSFGAVTIPLAQIHRVEASGETGVTVHLKNGDRVSGRFLAPKIRFETRFGVLEIPPADLLQLSSVSVSLGEPSPVATPTTPAYLMVTPRIIIVEEEEDLLEIPL